MDLMHVHIKQTKTEKLNCGRYQTTSHWLHYYWCGFQFHLYLLIHKGHLLLYGNHHHVSYLILIYMYCIVLYHIFLDTVPVTVENEFHSTSTDGQRSLDEQQPSTNPIDVPYQLQVKYNLILLPSLRFSLLSAAPSPAPSAAPSPLSSLSPPSAAPSPAPPPSPLPLPSLSSPSSRL